MALAKRVRDCRYAKGWGPDELAGRAEISRTALYQIECGKTELPRAATLRRIAKALDVSVEALLDESAVSAGDLASFAMGSAGLDDRSQGVEARLNEEAFADTNAVESKANGMVPPRERELARKLREILHTPLGEAVARMVEESHRLVASQRPLRAH